MRLSKNSDSNKINFLDKFAEQQVQTEKVIKQQKSREKSQEELNKVAEQQKSKKLDNSKAIDNISGKAILSAGKSAGNAGPSEFGGPKKHMGSLTNNSIWDTDIVSKLAETKCAQEKTKEDKIALDNVRKSAEKQRLDEMVQNLNNTDTRTSKTVNSLTPQTIANSQTPKNAISMFGNKEFDQIQEKTAGEKLSEEKNKQKEKPEYKVSKQQNLSGLINSLFDTKE